MASETISDCGMRLACCRKNYSCEKTGVEVWYTPHNIDEVRRLCVGLPHPHPDSSPELTKKDGQEMRMAYRIMLYAAGENLAAGRSIIVTATFSRKMGQQMILDLLQKHPGVELRAVWCLPKNDSDKEIERRLKRGFGESGYLGAVNSLVRYHEVKNRYEPIELFPALRLNTSSPNTIEDCVEEAIKYIAS